MFFEAFTVRVSNESWIRGGELSMVDDSCSCLSLAHFDYFCADAVVLRERAGVANFIFCVQRIRALVIRLRSNMTLSTRLRLTPNKRSRVLVSSLKLGEVEY